MGEANLGGFGSRNWRSLCLRQAYALAVAQLVPTSPAGAGVLVSHVYILLFSKQLEFFKSILFNSLMAGGDVNCFDLACAGQPRSRPYNTFVGRWVGGQ